MLLYGLKKSNLMMDLLDKKTEDKKSLNELVHKLKEAVDLREKVRN